MRTLILIILTVVLLAIVGGGIFLLSWDAPPPTQKVERVIPDDRFPD